MGRTTIPPVARQSGAYRGVREIFSAYWSAYGGTRELVRSPYLHASFVILLISWSAWNEPMWWQTVISVMPNIIGFSIGGFAVWLGFGDEDFRGLLIETDNQGGISAYETVNASFVHFILLEIGALLAALVAGALYFEPRADAWMVLLLVKVGLDPDRCVGIATFVGWGFAYWLFLYSLTTAVAATMNVFRVTRIFEAAKHDQAALNSANSGGATSADKGLRRRAGDKVP
jgi:hypothetical protein